MKHYILLFSVMLLGACSSDKALYVHTANKVFSPGIRDSGDIKVDGSMKFQSFDKNSKGSLASFSADVAWSPINHLGIFGSYRGLSNKAITHDRYYGGTFGSRYTEHQAFDLNGYAGDIGFGYYCRTGETGKFEVYGGFGMGNLFNSSNETDPGYYRLNYYRYFTQVGYGYDYDILSFMTGFRLSMEQLTSFMDAGSITADYGPGVIHDVLNTTQPYLDPYMELQLGGRHVKFNIQLGYDISLYPHPAGILYRPSAGYITMGVVYQRNPAARKKQ